MQPAAAKHNDHALAAAKELELPLALMNEVYDKYFVLSRSLSSHACALAIINGDLPVETNLLKKVIESDHQKNMIVADALYRRWFPQCDTVAKLSQLFATLHPQRRYMRAAYVKEWCNTYLNDKLPYTDVLALIQLAPQGSDDDERMLTMIMKLARI